MANTAASSVTKRRRVLVMTLRRPTGLDGSGSVCKLVERQASGDRVEAA
jgi:hypothetical protein